VLFAKVIITAADKNNDYENWRDVLYDIGMSLIISCDRYYILNGQLTIPVAEEDSPILGQLTNQPWVFVTDNSSILAQSRYDREESIEDIHRVCAAYVLEEDIFLTSPFDITNGINPQHCTRYCGNTIDNDSTIDPQSKIIGPLGKFVESMVDNKYHNANKYAEKTYIIPYLQRYSKIIDTESEESLKKLWGDYEDLLKGKNLFVKNPFRKDVSGCLDSTQVMGADKYNPFYIFELLETNPVFDYWLYQIPRFLLVQEEIRMSYETRFFVVDSNIVSASGRVIDCVPTQLSIDDPFHYAKKSVQHQSKSGDNQEVVDNTYYDSMFDYVEKIITTVEHHEKDTVTCVFDIAWSPDNQSPILVEVNGISNAGLYGCSAQAIYQKLYDNDCYQGLTLSDCREEMSNLVNNI